MSKVSFLSGAGAPVVPAFAAAASFAAHAVLALAAVGYAYGAGHGGAHPDPVELQVELEAPAVTDPNEEHQDVQADVRDVPAHQEAHTHPYPVAPNHDATPHSELIDHRASGIAGQLAAAPSVLTQSPPNESGRPTFSIVVGTGDGTTGGLSGASGTGDGSGTGGGGFGGSAAAPVAPASGAPSDEVFSEKAVSQSARLTSTLRPEYPAAARALGVEATVVLEIVVDRQGNVVDARVARGAGYGFEESALRALRTARFTPAIRNDVAVRVRMAWTVDFRLE